VLLRALGGDQRTRARNGPPTRRTAPSPGADS